MCHRTAPTLAAWLFTLVAAVGALVAGNAALAQDATPPADTNPAPATDIKRDAPAAPAGETKPDLSTDSSTEKPAATTPAPPPAPTPPKPARYKPVAAEKADLSTLGSTDPESGKRLHAQFTSWGAGIYQIDLTRIKENIGRDDPYAILKPVTVGDPKAPSELAYAFAAQSVTINDERIDLLQTKNAVWRLVEPGVYTYEVTDQQDKPVLRITRRYTLPSDAADADQDRGYDLHCATTFENLSGESLKIVWQQYAQGDIVVDTTTYMGDRRMVTGGYFAEAYDPQHIHIYTKDTRRQRKELIEGKPFWPHEDVEKPSKLVWFSTENRYFALITHMAVEPRPDLKTADLPTLEDAFAKVQPIVLGAGEEETKRALIFSLTSQPMEIKPGASKTLNLALFAGPRKNELFEQQPYAALEFDHTIVYELGCAFCTFQFLARGLLWFLKLFHGITFDWSAAIIILVIFVRLCLHPITKRAQVNMTKMGKQMQSLQPEMEKLKKKYENDPQKLRTEQARLMREKNINPTGMLGCLPMFLQTPIWIALYAMLYYAFELRHAPAFWGLFQAISGGKWQFLADLSMPDRLMVFYDQPQQLKLLILNLDYSSLNILPLAWGVMMFFSQKMTTPAAATPEAAQSQKIMRFMTLLFPFMLYSAPSGLMLYMVASSIAGLIDGYYVRKHIREEEAKGAFLSKSKPDNSSPSPAASAESDEPKKEGFFARLQRRLEEKMEEQRAAAGTSGHPGGRRAAAAERAMHAARDKAEKQRAKKNKKRK